MSRAGGGSVGARGGSPPAATQPAPRRSPSCTPANERGCTRSLFKPFFLRAGGFSNLRRFLGPARCEQSKARCHLLGELF